MPMSFPDFDSLRNRAKLHGFREPLEDEDEATFRGLLADFVQPIDFVESNEIRNKVGWDKFTTAQNMDMLLRGGLGQPPS